MAFPYTPVVWEEGTDNIAGLSREAYFAPIGAIQTLPDYDTQDDITRKGNITMKDGTCFVKLYVTYKTVSYKSEVTGAEDCRCYKVSGEFFHPGNTPEMARFARATNNTPGILILTDSEGKYVMVGSLTHPAYVSCSYDSGKKPDDSRGWSAKFEAFSTRATTFYEGTIDTDPA